MADISKLRTLRTHQPHRTPNTSSLLSLSLALCVSNEASLVVLLFNPVSSNLLKRYVAIQNYDILWCFRQYILGNGFKDVSYTFSE